MEAPDRGPEAFERLARAALDAIQKLTQQHNYEVQALIKEVDGLRCSVAKFTPSNLLSVSPAQSPSLRPSASPVSNSPCPSTKSDGSFVEFEPRHAEATVFPFVQAAVPRKPASRLDNDQDAPQPPEKAARSPSPSPAAAPVKCPAPSAVPRGRFFPLPVAEAPVPTVRSGLGARVLGGTVAAASRVAATVLAPVGRKDSLATLESEQDWSAPIATRSSVLRKTARAIMAASRWSRSVRSQNSTGGESQDFASPSRHEFEAQLSQRSGTTKTVQPEFFDDGISRTVSQLPNMEEGALRTSMMASLALAAGDYSSYLRRLRNILRAKWFEIVMCGLIMFNLATMGIEAQQVLVGYDKKLKEFLIAIEHILTIIFLTEVVLRCIAFQRHAYVPFNSQNVLNVADATIVLLTGVICVWILPMAHIDFHESEHMTTSVAVVRGLLVLRVFRLARLSRVVNQVEVFKDIQLIMRGIAGSVSSFLWSIIVLAATNYVFAVLGAFTIGSEINRLLHLEEEHGIVDPVLEEVHHYFGTLSSIMYSLAEILTIEGLNPHILRPVQQYVGWSWFYFMSYLALMHLLLLNLVTAMVVENALANSKEDEAHEVQEKDKQKKRELSKLNQLFVMMDDNGDGTLSWDEFKSAFANEEIRNKWKLLDFQPEECKELFRLLDRGDGLIPIEDFFDGLQRMKGLAQSKDVFRIMKTLEDLIVAVSHVVGAIRDPTTSKRTMSAASFQKIAKDRSGAQKPPTSPKAQSDEPQASKPALAQGDQDELDDTSSIVEAVPSTSSRLGGSKSPRNVRIQEVDT